MMKQSVHVITWYSKARPKEGSHISSSKRVPVADSFSSGSFLTFVFISTPCAPINSPVTQYDITYRKEHCNSSFESFLLSVSSSQ